ncbi:unnamed protein product [Fusarium graminearum]|nr:unnamed protein product [Fusarium graminearum]
MLSVAMSSSDAMTYLEEHVGSAAGRDIVVVCISSPRKATLSGSAVYIDKVKAAADSDGIFARKLKVDNGYHSPLMATIADEYRSAIGGIEAGTSTTTGQVAPVFYSSLGGTVCLVSALQNPDHWVDNLVSPLQFSKALSLMSSNDSPSAPVKKLGSSAKSTVNTPKITQVLEIGPHAALRGPIREIMELTPEVSGVGYESVLRRGASAVDTALGAEVDMSDASIAKDSSLVPNAPVYHFNHSNIYWNEGRISKEYRFRPAMRNELFGAPGPDWDPANAVWWNYMRISENPWVKHHRITGATIYPAAGMLVMAIETSRQMADMSRVVKGFRILDARFNVAVRVPATQNGLETQFYMHPSRDHPDTAARTVRKFSLSSYKGGEWREHCQGLVVIEYEQPYTVVDDGREDFEFREACKNRLESVEKTSKVETSFRQLYEHLSTDGLDFGATFQTLRDIRCGDIGEAVVTVERQDLEGSMPLGYLQDHLIHPTVLDGILQSIIVSLTKGGREIDQVMVPSEIGDLWFLGIRQAEARIVGMDVDTGKAVYTIDNFVITTVARRSGSSSSDAARGLCFNLDYKVDPALLDQETADKTLQPDAKCGATAQQAQLIQEVEMMCFLYIKRFWNRIYDENRDAKSVPYHEKYIAWIKHHLAKYDAGLIPHAMPKWRERTTDEYISQMETKLLTEGSAEGKLVVNVGRELRSILAGKSDALELFFKDKLVENAYRSGVGAELGYDRMVAYIDTLAHKNPALRVLEVVAGTGGATRPILKCLTTQGNGETGTPRFSHYAFTDISIGLFENAREMFKDSAARMSFCALNIENNLEQQGFSGPGEQDDVICAANVIHANKNLEATLFNVRKLLKPGGKVILYEMTNTGMIRTGFAFGLLPGWWLSVEEIRQFTPLAAPNDWSRSLKASGFSGTSYTSSPIKIITCGTGSTQTIQERLATVLETHATSLSTSINIVNLQDGVADLKELQETRCIFLGDIESNFLEYVHDDEYEAFQKLISSTKTLSWVNQGGGPPPKNPGADMCAVPGLLDSLQFQDNELYEKPLGPYDVEIRVHATSLNLLDVMIALGQVIGEAFGQECAGVVSRVGTDVERVSVGDHVCGLLRGAFNTFTRGSQWQFAKIPSAMDYAVAAAVPVLYTTAYYELHDLARLQAGESILIHWGAGGVGQAAIQLAKAVGAELFVTMGSIEKRNFVHEHYGIPLHHVLSSRDLSFVHGIKRLTDGRGVDVILNSTAGQTLRASWGRIAPYGRFIEIGKVDIFSNAGLPMGPFKDIVTFSFFNIGLISLERG